MDAELSVRAALDPLLVPLGFAPGQGGGGDDADIIWCAAYTDFKRRFPTLPQATEQDDIGEHACVDLTARLSLGRLSEVDLEAQPLMETLRAVGLLAESQQAELLLGSPAQDAAEDLRLLLVALFAVRNER